MYSFLTCAAFSEPYVLLGVSVIGNYCQVLYRLVGCLTKCIVFNVIADGTYSYHWPLNVVGNYIHLISRFCFMCHGSNMWVGILLCLDYRLEDQGIMVRFPTAFTLAMEPTEPPIQWVPGFPSLGLNWPKREADRLPTLTTLQSVIRMDWAVLYSFHVPRQHALLHTTLNCVWNPYKNELDCNMQPYLRNSFYWGTLHTAPLY